MVYLWDIVDDSFPRLASVAHIIRWIAQPIYWAWRADSTNTWWDPKCLELNVDRQSKCNIIAPHSMNSSMHWPVVLY